MRRSARALPYITTLLFIIVLYSVFKVRSVRFAAALKFLAELPCAPEPLQNFLRNFSWLYRSRFKISSEFPPEPTRLGEVPQELCDGSEGDVGGLNVDSPLEPRPFDLSRTCRIDVIFHP